uniref:Peptidase M55 D-aminopeptidase n=1 Tax=Chromera velia CCMP2878 TaxID=1169474 RepID=A0A0G4EZP2_9ALVE|eukprot:Cvel_14354.t1-p1 / transcript=Cvel_14354.t1 / gene=Cvel_14354 / organism=Chromera_velia_CCMP2878 / gene_product=hypothetical protein / transcript_product=hypothetical protein / location=Cvel_scaffold1018:418-2442(+) / protein_length=388 / sequence_SO=supercontig / SO=protein_coding / is_pseudo=false
MRILVSVDMEGIAGVVSAQQTIKGEASYEEARLWMTDEVTAAVSACKSVLPSCSVKVCDGHASKDNLLLELLPSEVEVAKQDDGTAMMCGVETCDLVIMLGYHGMARPSPEEGETAGGCQWGFLGSGSFLAHTNVPRWVECLSVNGIPLSEGLHNALLAKHFGVKLLAYSGTDVGVEEMRTSFPSLPAVVAVKSTEDNLVGVSPKEEIPKHIEKLKECVVTALKNSGLLNQPSESTLDCSSAPMPASDGPSEKQKEKDSHAGTEQSVQSRLSALPDIPLPSSDLQYKIRLRRLVDRKEFDTAVQTVREAQERETLSEPGPLQRTEETGDTAASGSASAASASPGPGLAAVCVSEDGRTLSFTAENSLQGFRTYRALLAALRRLPVRKD